MIKIACDLTTVKCTTDARWLQKFALPATKLRKNVKSPSAGCCDSLLLIKLSLFRVFVFTGSKIKYLWKIFFDHSTVNEHVRGFKSIVYTVNVRDQTACHKSMRDFHISSNFINHKLWFTALTYTLYAFSYNSVCLFIELFYNFKW